LPIRTQDSGEGSSSDEPTHCQNVLSLEAYRDRFRLALELEVDWYDEPCRTGRCTCLRWFGPPGTVESNVLCLRCRLPLCPG